MKEWPEGEGWVGLSYNRKERPIKQIHLSGTSKNDQFVKGGGEIVIQRNTAGTENE